MVYVSECKGITDSQYVSTCNMNLEETLLGATYALGQLDAHFGNFDDAEEILTAVLKKAEQCFGLLHQLIQTSRKFLVVCYHVYVILLTYILSYSGVWMLNSLGYKDFHLRAMLFASWILFNMLFPTLIIFIRKYYFFIFCNK